MQLQGAWVASASLEGASFIGAQLQGSELEDVAVWRASLAAANIDLVDAQRLYLQPMPRADISKLIADVESATPPGSLRTVALRRLAALTADMRTEQKRGFADPWRALRDREWHTDADDRKR
jgi:hypothetical protein